MRAFFRGVPASLIDAARIDGASSFAILRRVLTPIAGAPAIATVVVLMFMGNWNEFLLPVVMIATSARAPAPVALATFQGRFGSDIGALPPKPRPQSGWPQEHRFPLAMPSALVTSR